MCFLLQARITWEHFISCKLNAAGFSSVVTLCCLRTTSMPSSIWKICFWMWASICHHWVKKCPAQSSHTPHRLLLFPLPLSPLYSGRNLDGVCACAASAPPEKLSGKLSSHLCSEQLPVWFLNPGPVGVSISSLSGATFSGKVWDQEMLPFWLAFINNTMSSSHEILMGCCWISQIGSVLDVRLRNSGFRR